LGIGHKYENKPLCFHTLLIIGMLPFIQVQREEEVWKTGKGETGLRVRPPN